VVRRREHEDALVVAARAVELGQQLVDDVAPGGAAQLAALLAERVDLVEEDHARRAAARGLEDRVQPRFALAEPHVEHVVEADREERRTELARDRAREERLAAAWRAVEQQPAAQRLAVQRAQLGVAQRAEERELEPLAHARHAGDVRERHAGAGRREAERLHEVVGILVVVFAVVAAGVQPLRRRRRGRLRRCGEWQVERLAALQRRQQPAVALGLRVVAGQSRGVAGDGERRGVVGHGQQHRQRLRQRPRVIAGAQAQAGEVRAQRGVGGIGVDGGLHRGDDRRIDAHRSCRPLSSVAIARRASARLGSSLMVRERSM
jgi:hypothetical protein